MDAEKIGEAVLFYVFRIAFTASLFGAALGLLEKENPLEIQC